MLSVLLSLTITVALIVQDEIHFEYASRNVLFVHCYDVSSISLIVDSNRIILTRMLRVRDFFLWLVLHCYVRRRHITHLWEPFRWNVPFLTSRGRNGLPSFIVWNCESLRLSNGSLEQADEWTTHSSNQIIFFKWSSTKSYIVLSEFSDTCKTWEVSVLNF